jgi:hypothetical protein
MLAPIIVVFSAALRSNSSAVRGLRLREYLQPDDHAGNQ